MANIADHLQIRPTVFGALLILCRRLLDQLGVDLPETVAQIVELAGCGKSQPYVWVDRIEEALQTLGDAGSSAVESPCR
ncbi:MAG: hypothetical protein ABEN55_12865 [Bradymonadaceae bacterium]